MQGLSSSPFVPTHHHHHTEQQQHREKRSGIETLVIILITIVVVLSLSLSLSIPSVARKQFFSLFFPPFGNINQVIDLPLFHSSSSGSQALPNCVCSPTERGGGHTNTTQKYYPPPFPHSICDCRK